METAILHYGAFKDFLATHLAREQANGSRTNARDKLTRLTKNQFQELSTDVYDELTRRLMDSNEVPFLPLRDDFHPKRNQARQKLATLPKNRFKDLASDVYYELERRFPDLKDMDFSQRIDNKQSQPPSSSQPTYQQPLSPPPNPQSYQTNNKIQTQKNPSDFASSQAPNKNNIVPEISTLKQEVVDFTIQKQNSKSEMSNINGGIDDGPKPYTLKNGSSTNIGNNNIPNNYPPPPEYGSPMSPSSRTQSSASSVSDFGRRYMNVTSVSSISSTSSNPKNRDTIDGNVNNNGYSPKQSPVIGYNMTSEIEKIRSDYELKIATLQKKIKDLDLELSSVKKLGPTASNGKLADLQQQLDEQIRINKQQATKISQLEDDYYRLNEEHKIQQECTNDVQKEASMLLEEIKNLSKRNDELILEKEEDVAKISSLTSEMNEWKSKYEKTKTELRNLKATSSFYKEAPKMNIVNDHGIKPTPDGAIDESKIVSYQVAIDDLLRAGRSEDPTNVLLAMKSIVISCKDITEEVELYEKNKGSLMKAENQEKLTQIKTGLSTTLTNLMTAAKNHATGAGLSPVSLLDAAASHLTVAVVEVAKHLKLRRSPNDRTQDRDKKSSMSNGRSRGVGTEDLKDFLERQTEAIVQAIQTLLANIRNGSYGSYGGSIIEKINTIITILLNVIAVCNDSFEENPGTTYRTRGSTLLRELETCIEKMEEMRSLIENNDDFASDKASKQRLASVAFEIAKLTKELHGLVGK